MISTVVHGGEYGGDIDEVSDKDGLIFQNKLWTKKVLGIAFGEKREQKLKYWGKII